MKVFILIITYLFVFCQPELGFAKYLDFTVKTLGIKADGVDENPHVLVIGGIQGDEPGSFSAASLISTHYKITHGTVTVVPNLNFLSIIDRKRGIYGDMNRKFAKLDKDDPDYDLVKRIQNIINLPEIDLILNLHDGSGYYNPENISKIQNPKKWGNCVIIDQAEFESKKHGDLENIAAKVSEEVNYALLDDLHKYHVYNTKTSDGNVEMAKSLTWYALNQGKPAFGIEASKELDVSKRTYYHLLALESFFRYMGIEFERNFELSPQGISIALANDIYIGFVGNRFVLPLTDIRKSQKGSFPMQKNGFLCESSSPILTAIPKKNNLIQIHYGNNKLTTLKADWLELDNELKEFEIIVDGVEKKISFGSIVYVKDHIEVVPIDGYRLNAIGAKLGKTTYSDESGKQIEQKHFLKNYSIDKTGTVFRLEIYKEKKYAGTFIVQYIDKKDIIVTSPLPAIFGEESELGR